MKLELIHNMSDSEWDTALAQFDVHFLFQRSPYLRFLEAMGYGRLLRFKIVENDTVCGYFPAILMKKAFFNILATPLTGWKTEYMGPAVNYGFNTDAFLNALDDFCKRWGVHQVEIGNPIFEPNLMIRHGYLAYHWEVIAIDLSTDVEQMWRRLHKRCRNRIRKGLKNNLISQESDNPLFADNYYRQLIEVFERQKLAPHYPKIMVQRLVDSLKPHCLISTVEIKHHGKEIASGLFLYDNQWIYSFGIASETKHIHLCPNELLYWSAMTLGGRLGLKKFYVGGLYRTPRQGGIFKHKFNGHTESVYRYTKNFTQLAFVARKGYKYMNLARQAMKNSFFRHFIKRAHG